jgi:hypothetical protein
MAPNAKEGFDYFSAGLGKVRLDSWCSCVLHSERLTKFVILLTFTPLVSSSRVQKGKLASWAVAIGAVVSINDEHVLEYRYT